MPFMCLDSESEEEPVHVVLGQFSCSETESHCQVE